MDQDISVEDISKFEFEVDDVKKLNKTLSRKQNIILCVNIRSLNANFEKLEVFVESLKRKPCIIVCTETWNLQFAQYYQLQGYKICYNESKINKADGVLIYIRNNIYSNNKIDVVDRLSVVSTDIKLMTGESVVISAMYRCHDISKSEFVNSVKKIFDKT